MQRSIVFLLMLAAFAAQVCAAAPSKPRVRAITAFVRLDPTHYQDALAEAAGVLNSAKREFTAQGYETQTLRVVTQPLAQLIAGLNDAQALALIRTLDEAGAKLGVVLNVGPAMMRDSDDPRTVRVLEQALATIPALQASNIIAGADGIHWRVIQETAALVRYLTDHSPHSEANFRFTASAMLKPYGPFYPGAYHDGPGRQLSLGFESANVVQEVFSRTHGDFAASVAELTRELTVHAGLGETIGNKVAAAAKWSFMGVDPTPAPMGDVSIGDAIEKYSGGKFGSSGTLTAALVITTAVKAVSVRQVGYSGLMVPVMEDKVISQRWSEGAVSTDSLLAYSAVCGTGLDAVPYPGDISVEKIARILGDVAALAWKWNKPLTARLQPVKGKGPGEQTDFHSPYLFNTTLRALP